MIKQPNTSYAIVSGCNKCTPYYLVAGPTNEVLEYINKHVGGGFNVLKHERKPDLYEEGDEYDVRIYDIPKQHTKKFFSVGPSCYVEIHLYTRAPGIVNLQEMLEEVQEQVV